MHIVFQGDSITDCGRNTHSGSTISIGQSYPMLIASELAARHPLQYTFANTGISGNRIVDVYARIKADTWNLKPDVISMLIGINDVLHEVGQKNGVDQRRFLNVYRMLVTDSLTELPNVKMMLLEPFVVKGSGTVEAWDYIHNETLLRARAVRQIAEETNQIFVPLQMVFDEACKRAPAEWWIADGVHPTPAGHRLIADAWLNAFVDV